ncbi:MULTISPECIES: RluA family pseudouridine synthase [Carnobacterium]|uniref:Pseudouridine synthase n=1 Tax=Carnobacterium divergens TaxID=2748 RepID=A0A2R8A0U0_CARDV|nr:MULTISPECIES: RluA family pseudouridine synthase [Carnobacterium]MCO6017813.1 RluA family pseudouridine synthase [Carnobacterium divergens]MDT1938832.1 RluA family pseudouridine synthase [Carnobacterium divergens]MDT1941270.1 RluA family pseudouridine synthase [Carnobacterium divergens]MDT1947068.1 RluA family pseudouridine synthase [Carnobacterium divergens]MDT1949506.1 RluA family pseudouridine synthase [Carnobacterium divergens]
MTQIYTFTINEEKGRIDKVLAELLPTHSRSQIQQWVKEGAVYVNDEAVKQNYKVKSGDLIQATEPDAVPLEIIAEDIPLDIVYEDEDVMVVNKPQGMVVHPSAGHMTGTLVNALMYHVKDLSGINGVIRPGIVHRIDKDTSGLLMVAKNDQAHEKLAAQLKDKTSLREYVALVHGEIPHEKGTIDAPIGRAKEDRKKQAIIDDGRPAVTHFTVIEQFSDFTLVTLKLETGRTHQIRVHMRYIGYPIAGDPTYGPKKTLKGNGQFLHAKTLGFKHPTTGEFLTFEAPLPTIFENTLEELRNNN